MTGSGLLSWCFFLPVLAFLAALPFSVALSRKVASVLAIFNFLAPGAFYLSQDRVWFETLQRLLLPTGPIPLQLDSLSLPFVLLIKTATLLSLGTAPDRLGRTYLFCVFGADFALSGALLSADVFASLLFSQLSLVPLSILIGAWGGHDRLFASRKFFLAQTAACLLWLVALSLRASAHEIQFGFVSGLAADLGKATLVAEKAAFLCFLLGCLLRSAVFPLHVWLPDTLSQAPLAASLFIVAGVLPSGVLALMRTGAPVFAAGLEIVQAPAIALTVLGALYSGLLAWRQNDSQRYAAHGASVWVTLSLGLILMAGPLTWTSGSFLLLCGALSLMGALCLFEWAFVRQKSRLFPDWGGMGAELPRFKALVLFLELSLLALPGTAAFPGAFSLLAVSLDRNAVWCVGFLAALFLCAASRVRLMGTVSFGAPRRGNLARGPDLSSAELVRVAAIAGLLLLLGAFPHPAMESLERPIRAFWSSFDEGKRFYRPGDDGQNDLLRTFPQEEAP
jgi:NADH-quinone oxidoreductase subunit M